MAKNKTPRLDALREQREAQYAETEKKSRKAKTLQKQKLRATITKSEKPKSVPATMEQSNEVHDSE